MLPISGYFNEYAEKVAKALDEAGIRVNCDVRNEKIGYKIREAQLSKVPYMLVVGEKEQDAGTVSVRSRTETDGGVMTLDDFIARALDEIKNKK